MALPSVETPRYELTLPSTDKKVQYRPFLVKEEKILLMALESKDQKEMMMATKDILAACTFGQLDVYKLPVFDIEFIFLQIRARSIGEVAEFKVLCPDDKETYASVKVDLSKIDVQVDDKHTNKILIDEKRNLGIVFNYPTLSLTKAGFDADNVEVGKLFEIMAGCIDHIYEGDKVYPAKDSTTKELVDFLEQLPQSSFQKIRTFFDTMPSLREEIEVENPKTKVKSKVILQGIRDFFQ